ncbi:hypothetical protein [Dendrosporobacter quercicolus]|nr:hypothetical protein [Dendrosporobacter quercicolus]
MEVQAIIKKSMQFACLLLAIFLFVPGTAAAADDTIDHITVQVTASNTAQPPPVRIAKRMSASVSTIGESVLTGRKIAEVAARRDSYENLIREVFGRILVGYSVQQVVIAPGETTAISVTVTPWGEVVSDVALEVDFGPVSPAVAGIIRQDIGNIEERINEVLIGLPVDAVDWAGSVSKSMVRELLAAQLPEFRANLEVIPGTRTVVKLALIPQGMIVQDVRVVLKSQSIPNLLLLQARPKISEAANTLTGLPVAFVERHKDYFTARVQDMVTSQAVVKRYSLTAVPAINAATSTEINVAVETTKYNIALEGYLDFGRDHDSSSAKLHLGRYTSSKDEAFFEAEFVPRSVSWRFMPGWGRRLSQVTTVGIKYELNHKQEILWLNQQLGDNWQLRLEQTPSENYSEFGVRYKIHEFLSAEYVFTDKENWFRLVGNL